MANDYGTIARANVLLIPKFDKLGKTIEDAVGGTGVTKAGETIGSSLMSGIKDKLGGLGSKVGDAIGIDAKALKEMGGTAGEVLSSVASVGSKVVTGTAVALTGVAVAAGGAITALGKQAFDSFAQYEQLEGGVKTIFGEADAQAVIDNAQRAFGTVQMSQNDYMETVTGFSASLIQSLEGDTAAAADKADLAIRDMSDNANKMGTDIASIQNAYQGFAKSNYTMLDNLKVMGALAA